MRQPPVILPSRPYISRGMKVRLGAVQAEPAWNNLQAGIEKTCELIAEAGQLGVNVLVFPEVWIPGYPGCIWRESVRQSADYLIEYRRNSMRRDSLEMRRIQMAASKAGICIVLGYSERDGNTIYISQVRRSYSLGVSVLLCPFPDFFHPSSASRS